MIEKLPFELSEWLKNKDMKVVGENDMPAKIIAWDRKCLMPGEGKKKPVVALVQYNEYDLNERLVQCTENGLEYTPMHGFKQALWMMYDWVPKFKPGDIIIRDGVRFDILSYDDISGTYKAEKEDVTFALEKTLSVREQESWQLSSRKRVDIVDEKRVVQPSTRYTLDYYLEKDKDKLGRELGYLNAYTACISELASAKAIFNYNGIPHISADAIPMIREQAKKLYDLAKKLSKDEPLTVKIGDKEVNVRIVPLDGTVNLKLWNGSSKKED